MNQRLIAVVFGLAACLGGTAAAQEGWPSYTLEPSGVFASAIRCTVDSRHRTSDCKSDNRYLQDPTVDALDDDPLVLPDAPAGSRILLLVRRSNANARPSQQNVGGLRPNPLAPKTIADAMRTRYPHVALDARREERVVARCLIADDGWAQHCWLPDEPKDDMHFARATLEILRTVRFTTPLPAERSQLLAFDWRIPPPDPLVFVECAITPGFMTQDCTTGPDLAHPGAADAVLAALKQKPLRLVDAPVGKRIEIALLRSEIGRSPTIAGKGRPADYHPRSNLTTLNVMSFYPPVSLRLNEQGRSYARCKVTDEGRLNECWIAASSGFARLDHAHLRMIEVARVPPPTKESPPYDERIYRFALDWALN